MNKPLLKKIAVLAPTALALTLYLLVRADYAKAEQAERIFQAVNLRLNQKLYPRALADSERAVALSPGNAYYRAGRGLLVVRAEGGRFDAAAFLGKRLTLSEGGRKRLEAAARHYQEALALNPLDDIAYHNLGWLYASLERREEALSHFQKAVEIDSSIALYHLSLGLFHEQGGDQEAAYREYGIAVRLAPVTLDSRFFRDLEERSQGGAARVVAESIAQLEEQSRRDPNPIVRARLGKLYLHVKSLDKAAAELQQAVTALPTLSRAWYNLGTVYELQGNETATRECDQKATFLDVNNAVAWSRLGAFHDRRNNKQEATQAYARAVTGWRDTMSEHAGRASRVYHARFIIPDDVVPNGFLAYCNPPLDAAGISLRLAALYEEAGDFRSSSYYRDLSTSLAP